MRMAQLVFSTLVLGVVFSAALGAQDSKQQSQRYENPIVFCRAHLDESGKMIRQSKLWVMEEDGSGLRQLTFGPHYDDHPSFYADQEHVLFSEFAGETLRRDTEAKLIKLNIYTGERETVLAQAGRALHHATISPLGDDLIVYAKDTEKRHSEWFRLPPRAYELNTRASNGIAVSGDSVVFMHEKNSGYSPREVSLARIYGQGPGAKVSILTDDKSLHRRPAVSPDGKWLAWQSNAEGGDDEILLAPIDAATKPRNLTQAPGNDGHPWFSRDGKWIIFESDRTATGLERNGCDGRRGCEIWKVNIETGEQTQLTFGGATLVANRPRM